MPVQQDLLQCERANSTEMHFLRASLGSGSDRPEMCPVMPRGRLGLRRLEQFQQRYFAAGEIAERGPDASRVRHATKRLLRGSVGKNPKVPFLSRTDEEGTAAPFFVSS